MIVTKFLPGSRWYAEVWLDDEEWPTVDEKDEWLDRPVRRWVIEHATGEYFFSCAGTILFRDEEDLIMFQLTWG